MEGPKEIELTFTYQTITNPPFKCKSNEEIGNVLFFIAGKIKVHINNLLFLAKGLYVYPNDFKKPIGTFCSIIDNEKLSILVYNNSDSIETNTHTNTNTNINNITIYGQDRIIEIEIKLWFNLEQREMKFSSDTEIEKISRKFSHEIGRNFNSLIFRYGEGTLDFQKTIGEEIHFPDFLRKIMEKIGRAHV